MAFARPTPISKNPFKSQMKVNPFFLRFYTIGKKTKWRLFLSENYFLLIYRNGVTFVRIVFPIVKNVTINKNRISKAEIKDFIINHYSLKC